MSRTFDFGRLVDLCRRTHEETRCSAVRLALYRQFYQQHTGIKGIGPTLLDRLMSSGLQGHSPASLRKFRELYHACPKIQQTPSVISISASPASGGRATAIGPTPSGRFASPLAAVLSRPLDEAIALLAGRFSLGWSHYVTLLTICRAEERAFYEIEDRRFARLRSAAHGGEGGWLTRCFTAWIMVLAKRCALSLPTLKQVVDALGAKVGGCVKKPSLELA